MLPQKVVLESISHDGTTWALKGGVYRLVIGRQDVFTNV